MTSSTDIKETKLRDEKIGIVGSGLMGTNWAVLFAAGGFKVHIYDIESQQVAAALARIPQMISMAETLGVQRGTLTVEQQISRISGTTSLDECVNGAVYIQECVPEVLDLKRKVFQQLDDLANDDIIFASSSSTMPASSFSSGLKHTAQILVAHPINPPVYIPLVEVVPTPATRPEVVAKTKQLLLDIGQKPVILNKEVMGFCVNRLQYALMNECCRLVMDDVITVDDVDQVVRHGLGLRYAFIGPLETAHLNAEGLQQYCQRYGEAVYNTSMDMGPVPKWEGATVDKLFEQLCGMVPVEEIAERKQWRDRRLAALAKLKVDMDKQDQQQNK